jgi:riboflavin kinase/FMN adenylyltransferase
MRILSWEDFLANAGLERPLAATVGVFDGLHEGHRRLISKVFEHREGRLATVFTFRENPKRVLRPASFHGSLSSLGQKLEGLEALGLELCVLIDFSGNFSKLAGREFLALLQDRGRLEYMAIGSNFSCGYKLDTDARDIAAFYEARGLFAEVLEPVQWEGHAVSSSRVRIAIMDGRLDDAATMLGRRYELDLAAFERLDSPAGSIAYRRGSEFVLPPAGSYDVETGGQGSRFKARLVVATDRLVLSPAYDLAPSRAAFIGLTHEMKR